MRIFGLFSYTEVFISSFYYTHIGWKRLILIKLLRQLAYVASLGGGSPQKIWETCAFA